MKIRAGGGGSRGPLSRPGLFDDPPDVGLLYDQEILAIDAHLGAGPLAKQDAVARLKIERGYLTILVASTGSNRDYLALLGLLLGGVRDDDPALCLLFCLDTADHNTVVQGTKLHRRLQSEFVRFQGERGGRAARLQDPSPRGLG